MKDKLQTLYILLLFSCFTVYGQTDSIVPVEVLYPVSTENIPIVAQAKDRIEILKDQLDALSKSIPGLKEKVDFSFTGISVQDFVRTMAESNDLNISVDPNISSRIYNNFNNEEAGNILLFICKEYDLDLKFFGTIISVVPYNAPKADPVPIARKEIEISFKKEQNLITLNLKNDTLSKVLEKITSITNKNSIYSPEINSNQIINGFLLDVPFANGMEKLAFMNNLSLEISEDSFFIFKPRIKEIEEKPKPKTQNNNSFSSDAGFGNFGSSNNGEGSNQFSFLVKDSLEKIFVSFEANNADVNEVIKTISAAAKRNYFLFSTPSGKINLYARDLLYDDFLSYVLTGSNYTYKIENGVYLIGERKSEKLRATKVMQLKYRSFKEIEQAIPGELRQGVEIKEFPELNSFVLSGSAIQIAEIEKITYMLDQVVPLIMIEVIMVDIRRGKSLKTGIKSGLSDTTSGGTILPGLDLILSSASLNKLLSPINLGKVTKNFYVGLSALDRQDFADVQSMPKLATLNSHKANMTIGETRYYRIETQNVFGSINPNTVITQQYNSVQANLAIDITPVVSGDDHVTLDIQMEISDFVGDPPPNAPPGSISRKFTSLIRVLDGEMILLGGMERTSKSETGTGFPVLSRIPILKWFFSSRDKSKSKSISFVFIKPTISY